MTSNLVRTPLVTVVREALPDNMHTRLSYYVEETRLMEFDLLKDVVPSEGPLDLFLFTQLLVTPHEHVACLADILALAKAKEVEGDRWNEALSRAQSLLEGPKA